MAPANDTNLIVVHPVGRGGSIFIQSLFDGHSDVVTLPSLQEIYTRLDESIADSDASIDRFVRENPHLFDSRRGYLGYVGERVSGRFGPNADQDLRVSIDEFRSHARDLITSRGSACGAMGRKEFFVLLHLAYARSVGASALKETKFILYHPHSTQEYEVLLRDFPALHFIAMTRDPRQDWESWRRVIALRRGCDPTNLTALDCFFTAIEYSQAACEVARMAQRVEPGHFKALDLPRLHSLNTQAMLQLCQWLGLEFQESLLHSTFNGLAWMGNAATRRFTTGFDPEFKDKWRENLPTAEVEFISMLDYGAIKCYRYEDAPPRSAEDLNSLLAGKILSSLSSLSSHGTLRGTYVRYHLHEIKSAFIVLASHLQFRDSKAKYLSQIAGRLHGLGRQIFVTLLEIWSFSRFRDRDLPEMFRKLRKEQAYLESHMLSDDAFLTSENLSRKT